MSYLLAMICCLSLPGALSQGRGLYSYGGELVAHVLRLNPEQTYTTVHLPSPDPAGTQPLRRGVDSPRPLRILRRRRPALV